MTDKFNPVATGVHDLAKLSPWAMALILNPSSIKC